MTSSSLKRICLWSLIGFLSASALLAVVCLLLGDFGEVQVKIILSTLTISGASLCGMACSAFVEKTRWIWPGGVGIFFAAATALLVLLGIWAELNFDDYWKWTASFAVVAVFLAHALLLHIPTLAPAYGLVRRGLNICLAILVLQILSVIWLDASSSFFFRSMGAVAVIALLLTLVIPICARLAGGAVTMRDRLLLTQDEGDIFHDEQGRRYRVTSLSAEE